jgi:hypothetical protein
MPAEATRFILAKKDLFAYFHTRLALSTNCPARFLETALNPTISSLNTDPRSLPRDVT